MRKLLILLFGLLSIYSCKEIDKLTQFTMEYTSNSTIPATFGIDIPINIWTPDIPTNSETEFESNNTAKNLIEKIVLTKLDISITSPSSASFDFLKNIEIFISADGLSEKRIAWLSDIPKTGLKTIELNTSEEDLKEFIKADRYKLKTKTVTRQLISQDTDIEIKNRFFVDAKILGI
jgi:hypothetical protein